MLNETLQDRDQGAPLARRGRRVATISALVVATALASGCVERRVFIETDPPGALVWLNDAQIGRSPVDVGFTHHGVYDLRIEKEGYEPLVTPADTNGPIWDAVPLDFFAEVLPIDAKAEARWKFTLTPRNDSEDALVERASALRARAGDAKPVEASAAGSPSATTPEATTPAAPTKGDSSSTPGTSDSTSPAAPTSRR